MHKSYFSKKIKGGPKLQAFWNLPEKQVLLKKERFLHQLQVN